MYDSFERFLLAINNCSIEALVEMYYYASVKEGI
jgi:hypothetical protein